MTLKATVAILALLAGGCASLPDRTSSVIAPTGWTAPDAAGLTAPVVLDWWRALGDPELDALVERALQRNTDLRAADANLRAARALAGQADTAFLPRGDVAADLQRIRVSGLSQPPFEGSPETYPTQKLATVGATLQWELDLFGGLRANADAAAAQADEALWMRRNVEAGVAAAVVRAWADHRYAAEAASLIRARIALLEQALVSVQDAAALGGASRAEVATALRTLENAQSELPAVEAASRNAARRLSVLSGEAPSLNHALGSPALAPASIAAGDPVSMLRRRPDVSAAERAFASATAQARVAVSELYPRISFGGQFARSAEPGKLDAAGALGFSYGPALRWGLFDLPRLRLQVRAADAQSEAALARWEGTVLAALEEADSALDTWVGLRRSAEAVDRGLRSDEERLRLMQVREAAGQVSRLQRLELEAEVTGARQVAAQSRADELQAWISGQLALGAGWRDTEVDSDGPARP